MDLFALHLVRVGLEDARHVRNRNRDDVRADSASRDCGAPSLGQRLKLAPDHREKSSSSSKFIRDDYSPWIALDVNCAKFQPSLSL